MNTRNLRIRRKKGWAVVVTVPKRLQKQAAIHYGSKSSIKKEIVRGLGTRDLAEANIRKLSVIAEIMSTLASLEPRKYPDPIELSKTIDPNDRDALEYVEDIADDIRMYSGLENAKRFYDIATHKSVPVSIASAQWLSEASAELSDHTRESYKAALDEFIVWSNDSLVKSVTPKTAGQYVSHLKTTPSKRTGKPPAPNTLNRKVRTLGALWKWLAVKGIIDFIYGHIWENQIGAAPGEKRGRAQPVKELRAITKEEAQSWMTMIESSKVKYKEAMRDMVILAWHTGVRAEDLCSLTITQVREDTENHAMWLQIINGKTGANSRTLPVISPEAIKVLKRRIQEGKEGTLFYQVEPEKASGKRYARLQRKINPLRKKALGVAPVDFHSFRRAFSHACEAAAINPIQWSRMMGHEAPTLAASVYNRGFKSNKLDLDAIKLVHLELGELT